MVVRLSFTVDGENDLKVHNECLSSVNIAYINMILRIIKSSLNNEYFWIRN